MEKPIKKETVKVYNENEEKLTCFDECESECLYEYKNKNEQVYNHKNIKRPKHNNGLSELDDDKVNYYGDWGTERVRRQTENNNGNYFQYDLDDVENPSHYKLDGLDIESIDVVKSVLGQEGFRDFCLGNILKYGIRCKKKGQFDKDIRKIKRYSEFIIKCEKEG